MSEPLRLNLGAGAVPIEGYVNLDRKTGQEIYPLDYPDECADELRASHCLEHLPHAQSFAALREWVRVLKPGGVLKVAVPDFRWIAEKYLRAPDQGDEWPLNGYVMGGQVDADDYHKAIFDTEGLTEAFRELGLVDISPWVSDQQDCAALPVSLNLQGTKPLVAIEATEAAEPALVEYPAVAAAPRHLASVVAAVCSMPRLAFTENMFCVVQATRALGISFEKCSGVFWQQAMSNLFDRHLEDGIEYLLTLDYDTVFVPEDVLELFRLLETHPTLDAVCSMQSKREDPMALFTVRSRDGKIIGRLPVEALNGELLSVGSAHFGLTLIRVSALKTLRRPWFHAQPAPNGQWADGQIDADVVFWNDWREQGKTLALAPRVVVGHCQMMVSWPGRNLRTVHQYISDYSKDGKPNEAWS